MDICGYLKWGQKVLYQFPLQQWLSQRNWFLQSCLLQNLISEKWNSFQHCYKHICWHNFHINDQKSSEMFWMRTFNQPFFSTVASISPGLPFFSRQQFLQEVNNHIKMVTTMMVVVMEVVMVEVMVLPMKFVSLLDWQTSAAWFLGRTATANRSEWVGRWMGRSFKLPSRLFFQKLLI